MWWGGGEVALVWVVVRVGGFRYRNSIIFTHF